MTAWPPTTRYLTPVAVKRLNSSSKSEFIFATGFARVGVDYQLPGGLEDGGGAETLPIGDVERTIHVGEASVALHDEGWGGVLHAVSL
jgi:hypothetical protein